MRNIFLEKSCTKCGGETSPISFSGKLKLSISLDQYPFHTVVFIASQVEYYLKYIESKLQNTYFYFILNTFKK